MVACVQRQANPGRILGRVVDAELGRLRRFATSGVLVDFVVPG